MLVELAIGVGGIGGAIAAAAGAQHLWDRYSKRGLYARVQRDTGERFTDLTSTIRESVGAAPSTFMDLGNKIEASLASVSGELAGVQVIAQRLASLDPSAAVGPIADRIEAAITNMGAALADTLVALAQREGARDMQEKSVDARRLNTAAKLGAKQFLARLAGQAHPALGVGVGIASTIGLIDDKTAEEVATFLLDNPELMAKINEAGLRVAQGRGIVRGSGFAPGLTR